MPVEVIVVLIVIGLVSALAGYFGMMSAYRDIQEKNKKNRDE
jgi:type II secretory pathway pseudopilin PulG